MCSDKASRFLTCIAQNHLIVSDWAEILSKKDINGKPLYYIHFDDCKYSSSCAGALCSLYHVELVMV